MPRVALFAAIVAFAALQPARAAPIAIVAAENFYGDVAQQIGGAAVAVTSILSNPDQDPHLFEASPSVARAIAGARIVISNGIDYDPWAAKLMSASPRPERKAIVIATLLGKKPGDNPHIWYDPHTMPAMAQALTRDLVALDPANAAQFHAQRAAFDRSLQPITAKIASLRRRLAGVPVAATEPVFGYMLEALGMVVRERRFQLAVMNNTEPSASDVAAFENDLKLHRVRLLVYNSQVSDPVAQRMMQIAEAAGVPIVGVTETEPPGTTYQAWMLSELDAVERALPG